MRVLGLASRRLIDVLGAACGLVLLAPAFALIALIIKFSDPGPVFFEQERVGRWGKPFKILKFRSMHTDAERILRADPVLWESYVRNGYKLPDGQDPRITPIGRWFRKTSLDELPQLWNVLIGEMSLVGPRPLVREEVTTWYRDTSSDLLSVRPGMTGAWQVSGRSDLSYPERSDLELYYVRTRSLLGDLRILLRTVLVVAARKGAH